MSSGLLPCYSLYRLSSPKNPKMTHLHTRCSFIGGAFALLLLAAGCASNQTTGAHSEPDMLLASGFVAHTPTSTQQAKLQALTAGQISQIQTRRLTLYVYPDWPNRRVLVGGPVQYQAYQQHRLSEHLPAENPPQVYRGPASFDWRKWYHEGGEHQGGEHESEEHEG